MFRRRNIVVLVAGALLACLGASAAVLYLASPRVTVRVGVGPAAGEGPRFMKAFAPIFAEERPAVRFESVTSEDFDASSKALERGDLDLLIMRGDVSIPLNGQTIVLLRRDNIAILVPTGSPIEGIENLSGKTIGILAGRLQHQNEKLFDLILAHYSITPTSIKRLYLTPSEVGAAIRQKKVAAVFGVGPISGGPVSEAVAAITKATKAAPSVLAIDAAEAIAKRWPVLETAEIPTGGLQGNPATPDEAVATLATTIRLVARSSLPDFLVNEITRVLVTKKSRLVLAIPEASHIEAPDIDEKASLLPVHHGAALYYGGEPFSVLGQFETLYYPVAMAASLVGAVLALGLGFWRKSRVDATKKSIDRLISIIHDARQVSEDQLEAIEEEIESIKTWSLEKRASEEMSAEKFEIISVAIQQARKILGKRRLGPAAPALST